MEQILLSSLKELSMVEVLESNDYLSLIDKAYIEPIKSVLAIDDKYKSLDDILQSIKHESPEEAYEELDRQIETLQMVRKHNWIADMSDGQTDSTIFERLHQCDLLLLDYHLDPINHSDPEKALNILTTLNNNHHFNLVVIYTAEENLKKVRTQIFTRLSNGESEILSETNAEVDELFRGWEEEGEDYLNDILDAISLNELEEIFSDPSSFQQQDKFDAYFSPVQAILDDADVKLNDDIIRPLYSRLLKLKVDERKSQGEFLGSSEVKIDTNNNHHIWLKTDKLFIAVVSKKDVEPSELIKSLRFAIESWQPTCHRLLLSKIKNELDDNGQTFENEVLKCDYTNLGWLEQFSKESEGVYVTISRLMEGLTSSLRQNENLEIFGRELQAYIKSESLESVVAKESSEKISFNNDLQQIRTHLNSYICSHTPRGNHLSTGHILEWKEGKDLVYFVCLTPACDLEPGRAKGWKEQLDEILPVKLLKLESHEILYPSKSKLKKLICDITSNNHIFINIDSKVHGFSFSKDAKSNPHWEQCFAEKQGVFEQKNGEPIINLARTRFNKASLCLDSRFQQCRVVGQLRQEYAINLLNKLGASLTRVGLDFVNLMD